MYHCACTRLASPGEKANPLNSICDAGLQLKPAIHSQSAAHTHQVNPVSISGNTVWHLTSTGIILISRQVRLHAGGGGTLLRFIVKNPAGSTLNLNHHLLNGIFFGGL